MWGVGLKGFHGSLDPAQGEFRVFWGSSVRECSDGQWGRGLGTGCAGGALGRELIFLHPALTSQTIVDLELRLAREQLISRRPCSSTVSCCARTRTTCTSGTSVWPCTRAAPLEVCWTPPAPSLLRPPSSELRPPTQGPCSA